VLDRLRVAQLTPTYFSDASVVGGGERYVHNLARALGTVDAIETSILAMGPDSQDLAIDGVPMRLMKRLPQANAHAMEALSAELWTALDGIDLVHIHQSLTFFGAVATAIVRSRGIACIGTDLGGGADRLMLAGHGLELLDGVLSISAFAKSLIDNAFSGPSVVMIGPIDTDIFAPAPGIERDPRLVLCVGRILPHKGIDRIIGALPPGLRLVVAGRVYHEPYHALLREMAAGKDVTFVHDADDAALLALYRRAGVLVQASTARDVYGTLIEKSELMGLTTLEAMACGLPVVVSDTGSLPELVPDPRFGRVFADDAALAAILREVEAGIWPAAGAGAAARMHVVAEHGMAPIGVRLAGFYRAVHAAARWRA
jgi:glycosyltransferase involved in cell wall biosynthesis